MFMCNQTKVNGRILPCNTTKQGFIILAPSGFMDAISTHHMTALSVNFPSAMSHPAPCHYTLLLQSIEPPSLPPPLAQQTLSSSASLSYKMYVRDLHEFTLPDVLSHIRQHIKLVLVIARRRQDETQIKVQPCCWGGRECATTL